MRLLFLFCAILPLTAQEYSQTTLQALVEAEAARLQQSDQPAPPVTPAPTATTLPATTDTLDQLLAQAKALLLDGDSVSAQILLQSILQIQPQHPQAMALLQELAAANPIPQSGSRLTTRSQLLQEVEDSWRRPLAISAIAESAEPIETSRLRARLSNIVIPRVNFTGVPLADVVETLSVLAEQYDPQGQGINLVLIDPQNANPAVHINLRALSLDRIIDFITEAIGFDYDVRNEAVIIRQGSGDGLRLETEFYPITRSTLIRLTGLDSEAETATRRDPLTAEPFPSEMEPSSAEEEQTMRNFLQKAGVPFDSVQGANLALADGQMIVTQTPRNLEKVRNILRRYTEIKQVEIETRFLEVQQGDLEEIGFQYSVTAGEGNSGQIGNRALQGAFGTAPSESQISIIDDSGGFNLPVVPPNLTNQIDTATGAPDLANLTATIGTAQINAVIRALSRKTGNDLMSAPKITVLSGKTAEIIVAQEFLYPQSYSDTRSAVGRGISDAGDAGVTITAGTPRDFTRRNIGVEMEVTPSVEDDNSISLLLEPRVTEFEGFVEYGGQSVAISGGRTVTVPSGFFQPIFSVRKVRTEVTIWDGATVVMGGLTRDQTVTVQDKVPIIGDIPLLGRLFRSEGESSQKRNLLIFVTAHLVNPGGGRVQNLSVPQNQ